MAYDRGGASVAARPTVRSGVRRRRGWSMDPVDPLVERHAGGNFPVAAIKSLEAQPVGELPWLLADVVEVLDPALAGQTG